MYWTKPDSTGKEVARDVGIDESKYTEFVNDCKGTDFEDVYCELSKKFKRITRENVGFFFSKLTRSFAFAP